MRHRCWLVAALFALGCGDSFTSSETSMGGAGGTTPGTGGATGGGGTAGGGGATVEPCAAANSIDNLVDSFDGNALSEQWEPWGVDQSVSVEGGVLRIDPADGAVGVRSAGPFNLRNCRVHIDITHLPNHTNEPVEAWFELKAGEDNLLSIYVRNGHLAVLVREDGLDITSAQLVFEPAENRFWRFLDQGGSTKLQIAGGDHVFTTVKEVVTPSFVDAVMVELGAQATADITGSAGQFGVAGVNTPF